MSARDALLRASAQLSDDALAALGNRGLLRRATKDLLTATVAWQGGVDALTLKVADQQIHFDRPQPNAGHCDCPAHGACQHLLVALLWLRAQALAGPPVDQQASDPEQTLRGISDTQLRDFVGKPGWRWVNDQLLEMDASELVVQRDGHLSLQLPRLGFSLHCLGEQFDAWIADAVIADQARLRRLTVLAVLLWRAQNKLPLAQDQAPATQCTDDKGSLEAGRLLSSIGVFTCDCVEQGLTPFTETSIARCKALALSARANGWWRLAASLRQLASGMEAHSRRLASADEEECLDLLTLIHGLCQASRSALDRGDVPKWLLGRARADYDELLQLELIGFAAWPFRTSTSAGVGHAGLTVLCYAPTLREYFTLTDARPATMMFDPIARFRAPGPWLGLSKPEALLAQRTLVQMPKISMSGRIAASEQTWLASQPQPCASGELELPPIIANWSDIEAESDSQHSLLRESQKTRYVLLAPKAWRPASFDTAKQCLWLELLDVNDRSLLCELPWQSLHANAIVRLEQITQEPCGDTWVLVAANARTVQPRSLLRWHKGRLTCDSLYFDAETPCSPSGVREAGRLEVPTRSDSWLVDALATLLSIARAGTSGKAIEELKPLVANIRALGVEVGPNPGASGAETLLRLRLWLLQVAKSA